MAAGMRSAFARTATTVANDTANTLLPRSAHIADYALVGVGAFAVVNQGRLSVLRPGWCFQPTPGNGLQGPNSEMAMVVRQSRSALARSGQRSSG
jgi:hypothetical protein